MCYRDVYLVISHRPEYDGIIVNDAFPTANYKSQPCLIGRIENQYIVVWFFKQIFIYLIYADNSFGITAGILLPDLRLTLCLFNVCSRVEAFSKVCTRTAFICIRLFYPVDGSVIYFHFLLSI